MICGRCGGRMYYSGLYANNDWFECGTCWATATEYATDVQYQEEARGWFAPRKKKRHALQALR